MQRFYQHTTALNSSHLSLAHRDFPPRAQRQELIVPSVDQKELHPSWLCVDEEWGVWSLEFLVDCWPESEEKVLVCRARGCRHCWKYLVEHCLETHLICTFVRTLHTFDGVERSSLCILSLDYLAERSFPSLGDQSVLPHGVKEPCVDLSGKGGGSRSCNFYILWRSGFNFFEPTFLKERSLFVHLSTSKRSVQLKETFHQWQTPTHLLK